MTLQKLWRFETSNPYPDDGCRWFFWQKASPYKLRGAYTFEMVRDDLFCEVYTIGSKDLLWSGLLCDVPDKFRSFLTEVRVAVSCVPAPPPA